MDRDVGEIEIETAVVPYDEEDFGYPSGREPYMNGQQKTFKGTNLRLKIKRTLNHICKYEPENEIKSPFGLGLVIN